MKLYLSALLALAAVGASAQNVTGPLITIKTNLGDINVQLLPVDAPKTVANFLGYVNSGAYNNSFFHRSVQSGIYIEQGGGFAWTSSGPVAIPQGGAVQNEAGDSNVRGTLAMALLSGQPNSATNEFFFNNQDNSAQLDSTTNGPFTVFGKVNDQASLAVLDAIAVLNTYDLTDLGSSTSVYSAFGQIPLENYTAGSPLVVGNLVIISAIVQAGGTVTNTPVISSNGVIMASAFGGYRTAAPGAFIEIYGSNLAGTTRGWTGSDFVNGVAPTMLDNVSVTIGGVPAYVSYVSPTQVNVEIPDGAPVGGGDAVILTYNAQTSIAAQILVTNLQGGILAPASFNVNGKQYAAAYHADNSFVTNGTVPGVKGTPAKPGETIVFYGLGFGPVNPATVPYTGQIAQGTSTLQNPVTFLFNGAFEVTPVYQGLSPGLTGVDQFDVTVPQGLPAGDASITVMQNGQPIAQTALYIPVAQ
jgi:uncharacterized protein (TIGR03437 family)